MLALRLGRKAFSPHKEAFPKRDPRICPRLKKPETGSLPRFRRLSTLLPRRDCIGNGDPDDPESCPLPSGDTSATGRQGTLCTFFKYVAGGLQPANKFVSLSPAYKTKYVPVKDDDGQWKSSVYFECHYFDVSLNPATGQPFWTAKSHVSLDGEAKKIDGRWLLTHVSSSAVPVPVP